MKTVIRVGTYPTSIYKSMGTNSYMISGMDSIKTIFVSPKYEGNPFPEKKNTTLLTIPFLIKPSPSGIKKIPHEIKRLVKISTFSTRVIWLILKERPEIVHIHSPMFFLIAVFARLKGARCYITYHGNEHEKIYNNKILGTIFNSVFFKTFSLSSDILKYGKVFSNYRDKFVPIDNAVDSNVFFDKKIKRKKVILAVGRLEDQKDYPTLINAFAAVLQQNPDYKLNIVGSGQLEKSIRQQAIDLGIMNSVKLLGQVSQDDLPYIYNESDIFVMSSLWEGFPKVLLEAIACGCKVVSTRVDSAPRVLGSTYPFLVNPGDHLDLFQKINSIIIDDKNIKFQYKEILNRYSWDEVKLFMEKEYNS